MPKAYSVICHRSTRSPEKFAALAAYETADYKQALRALDHGAERDLRIVEGV